MAQVTLTLGAPTNVANNNTWIQWDERSTPENLGNVTVLSEDPATMPRYLTRLRIYSLDDARIQLQFVVVPGTGTSGFEDRNEDLSVAFEQYASALTLQYAGAADFVIPGPDNANVSGRDDSEWYEWRRSADLSAQNAWYSAYQTAGRPSLTLILDDGTTPPPPTPMEVSASASAGLPTASFNATAIPVTPQEVSASARAGNPTGTFNADALTFVPVDLSMSARAGSPAVRFQLGVREPPPVPLPPPPRQRVSDGIITAEANVALLITQWRESAKMVALMRGLHELIDVELVQPLKDMEDMRNIDLAVGVWLDCIGERLGFPRPYVQMPATARFGFEGVTIAVGFNQAPFRSVLLEQFDLTPIIDRVYRNCLKVWAGALLASGTIKSMNEAVQRVFPSSYYTDGLDGSLTLTITTTTLTTEKQVLTDNDRFPRPAGIALTVV